MHLGGETYAGTIGALFLETSALTGHNIEKLFKDIGKITLKYSRHARGLIDGNSTVPSFYDLYTSNLISERDTILIS